MTAPNSSKITITDPGGYRNGLQQIDATVEKIRKADSAGASKFLSALKSAASAGVAASAGTGVAGADGRVTAPVYADTLAAAGKAVENVSAHIDSAVKGLEATRSNLQSILASQSNIDQQGTAEMQGS